MVSNNIMNMREPTIMQKKAANNYIDMLNRGRVNKKKALLDAGYSKYVASKPSEVMESKGFLKILDDAGLNEESLASYLSADLRAKPANRLGELKLLAELRGLKSYNNNVNVSKAEEAMALMRGILDGEEEDTNTD